MKFHIPSRIAFLFFSTTLTTTIRVYDCFVQSNNLDWFPRLRALSLMGGGEGEGGELELRALQAQLDRAQRAVHTLTDLLTELRDQVTRAPIHIHKVPQTQDKHSRNTRMLILRGDRP